MPRLHASQHIFCNATSGYFPNQGRGFQTVAVAEEMVRTEDLRALEDAAFYTVSPERRAAGDFPVKQTFFRLPSDKFAIGQTVDWGTDSVGREGNYLAYHLILSRDELLAVGANPFVILDAARLAGVGIDLTPRALPPLVIDVTPVEPDFYCFDGIRHELLANLAAASVDRGEKTALLIGDEAKAEGLLRGLFAAMAAEERLHLTFSTHFYESSHLRSLFTLATVRSQAEAPAQENYVVFDLDDGEFTRIPPASAYADWLADCLLSRRWGEIIAFNGALDGLRYGREIRRNSLPTSAKACKALWERSGTAVARALIGDGRLVAEFLGHLPSPQSLAGALLNVAAPSEMCGANTLAEDVNACLSALRSAATRKAWRAWVKRWNGDPMLEPITQNQRQWWKRLWQ